MEIVNRIKDGLHQDHNVYDQPDFTMRDNLNGVITDLGNGNFKWSNIKGNLLSFTIGTTDNYFSHCQIQDTLYILTLSTNGLLVKLFSVAFTGNLGALTLIWSANNSDINLSYDHPIRTIFGFYENENIKRIYWSDWNNPPRCINVANLPSDVKFIDFYPVIDKVYGRLLSTAISAGGNVKAGSVFFAWRYYTDDGYFTDWSPLTNPIIVTGHPIGTTVDGYQAYQGMAPDENTTKRVDLTITDIDDDYTSIQVCAFYSNDYNIANPGTIIYDGAIGSTTMSFSYIGNENIGTVTIDDLVNISIKIDKFKDACVAKKQNVIACIEEREELPLPAYLEADIEVTSMEMHLDNTGYPGKMTSSTSQKALFGMVNSSINEAANALHRGVWYKAITQVVYNPGTGNVTIAAGDMFYIPGSATSVTYVSGTFKAATLKRKYRLASGTPGGDVNTDYRYEYELLDGEYYDWKSQKVCKAYKSYPQKETVRLGVLFFDKTGRPFQVRHLRNTNVSYGLGDTHIPHRDENNRMLGLNDWVTVGSDGYYSDVCARLQYLKVSDLDISDIKDDIGGFMIVRAPIIREYLAMGILVPTYLDGNDVYSFPGLWPYANNANNYFGCYSFYCPEDLFNFKDFSIQPDDELENLVYLTPFVKDESTTIGGGTYQGLGRRESGAGHDFYQKFFDENKPGIICADGLLGLSHKIISVTKYTLGDTEVPINPLDSTKLYYEVSYNSGLTIAARGTNNHHSVVILDIDDNAISLKGPSHLASAQDNPLALLCSLKRPNTDPYNGYDLASIANSVYITTGHYQEINTSVLADIEDNGTWIFNDIEIFGGDTFVQLFDMKRLYTNHDIEYHDIGHAIIFPVESRMNLAMREGEHVAKTRSYDPLYNTGGLKLEVGNTLLEEFNYNDGYSSDNINDQYLPVPFNNILVNKLHSRIRYSVFKNYGEKRDNFRYFLANDYIDLDPNKGDITNIKYKNNRLIYWQPDEVGYIPISERALTQTDTGDPIQLGVGGIFERYDQLIDKIGNSNQFGLIESPLGFHWYDAKRKIYISIGQNLQISQESILKGLDSFFQNNITDLMDQYDNPFAAAPAGIYGGYDPMTKMIFSSFVYPGTNYTIGIHATLNKFVGKYDLAPFAYITLRNHLFHINPTKLTGYIHGFGTYMNFFGTQYHAYVSIVVKEETNIAKIYDTFEIIANSNFFNKVRYANSSQTKEEVVCSYAGGSCVVTNRDYKFSKKRWFGSYPKVSRERLNDGYLLVTFEIENPYLVELYEVKSTVRKNY